MLPALPSTRSVTQPAIDVLDTILAPPSAEDKIADPLERLILRPQSSTTANESEVTASQFGANSNVTPSQYFGWPIQRLADSKQAERLSTYMSLDTAPDTRISVLEIIRNTTAATAIDSLVKHTPALSVINRWLSESQAQQNDMAFAAIAVEVLGKLPISVEALRTSGLGQTIRHLVKNPIAGQGAFPHLATLYLALFALLPTS
eukprot:jgi/Hompol1/5493/HPOL_000195-RA